MPAPAEASSAEDASNGPIRQHTLSGISLRVRQGELIGLCGPVGCGKTSMLMAVVGELPRVTGSVRSRGRLALCAQEPWLQHASVRDNILFGRPYDEERYRAVLYACALEPDLADLAAGDASQIGERGLALSGGQRARVALARAAYSDAPVVLLDDPLAAREKHEDHVEDDAHGHSSSTNSALTPGPSANRSPVVPAGCSIMSAST